MCLKKNVIIVVIVTYSLYSIRHNYTGLQPKNYIEFFRFFIHISSLKPVKIEKKHFITSHFVKLLFLL